MALFFSEHFKRQLKRLKKKYPQIKEDLLRAVDAFNPQNEISIGRSIYKIRISSSDMRRGGSAGSADLSLGGELSLGGRSGGFRSYIFLYRKKYLLVPLCIYAKTETENITENELEYHFLQTFEEIIRTF